MSDTFETMSRKLVELSGRVRTAEGRATLAGAMVVRNKAIDLISEKSNGKEVVRHYKHKASKKVTVSRKGDAPNTDTGTLVASIGAEPQEDGSALVGSSLKYAKHLEVVHDRPWLSLAYNGSSGEIKSAMKKALWSSIKK